MVNDKFEIRPVQDSSEASFRIATPDFGALLQKENKNATDLLGACGLLATGALPEVQLALQDTAHKPNDHVHQQVAGIGQLEFDYDDHGKLASAHLDYGHGDREDAKFVDGHIVENSIRGQFNSDYTFYANGKVASESFEPVTKANQYYEFDEKGNVTLAIESNPDHSSTLLANEPGHHDIVFTDRTGNRATLNYDNNQQFQDGEIRGGGVIWDLKHGKSGAAEVFPEREA